MAHTSPSVWILDRHTAHAIRVTVLVTTLAGAVVDPGPLFDAAGTCATEAKNGIPGFSRLAGALSVARLRSMVAELVPITLTPVVHCALTVVVVMACIASAGMSRPRWAGRRRPLKPRR